MDDDEDFWLSLIWDLQIEAEKDNTHKDYSSQYRYSKRIHPKDHRSNSLESKEPYICPKCKNFHASAYVKGQKPSRCIKCHKHLRVENGIVVLAGTV